MAIPIIYCFHGSLICLETHHNHFHCALISKEQYCMGHESICFKITNIMAHVVLVVGGEERAVSHQHLYILPAVTKEKLHHCPSNCNLKKKHEHNYNNSGNKVSTNW